MTKHGTVKHLRIRRNRRSVHYIRLRAFHPHAQAKQAVGQKVEPEQLQRSQRVGKPQKGKQQHGEDLTQIAGNRKFDKFPQIVIDGASFLNRGDNCGKIVIEQHHVRRFLGHVGAGDPHGDADVGPFQGRRVVDAVTGHGHYFISILQHLYDLQLVLRGNPRIHRYVSHPAG